ncbi:hypothetical protein [Mesorhizobium escarrei]|uniref:Reverse transcriptase domain-containing protein n=1 Tax=Mesorhizobium escarrei TaxID=666018 RepID=A0ABN8K464_9HYPH|nr:hypothetical protein MES5069_450037 [Mesorhizobium escarrei]
MYQRTKAMPSVNVPGGPRQAERYWDRMAGRCVFLPVRYADDFVVLMSGTQEDALAEKTALADYLCRTTGLELSPEKTKVTAMTSRFEFLGFRFVMHWDRRYSYGPRVEIPNTKAADLRWEGQGTYGYEFRPVQSGFQASGAQSHPARVGELPPPLCLRRPVFTSLDWYTGMRVERWLRKKRPKARPRDIWAAYQASSRRSTRRLWREGLVEQHMLAWIPVCRFRLAWMDMPDLPCLLESRVRNKYACPVRGRR